MSTRGVYPVTAWLLAVRQTGLAAFYFLSDEASDLPNSHNRWVAIFRHGSINRRGERAESSHRNQKISHELSPNSPIRAECLCRSTDASPKPSSGSFFVLTPVSGLHVRWMRSALFGFDPRAQRCPVVGVKRISFGTALKSV